MEILGLKTTHIIQARENLLDILDETLKFHKIRPRDRDILIITEKVAALCEGRIYNLSQIKTVTEKAMKIATDYQLDPRLVELVSQEASHIFGGVTGMLLTVNSGILIANAGIDHSNAGKEEDYILWPAKPYETCAMVAKAFKKRFKLRQFGVAISDSRVQPLKRGVVGVAIGVAGFEPIEDCRGRKDLFGYKMRFKVRGIADQLTDAALAVMGECDERTPFALIRDAPVEFTDAPIDPQDMLMPMDEDLFIEILRKYEIHKIQ